MSRLWVWKKLKKVKLRYSCFALLAIFVFGFFIRFFPVRVGFHYWDETVYLQHAEIIANLRENKYNEFDFRPPLLPLMLALGYKIKNSIITAHFIISFLSSLGIVLVFFLSKTLFDDKTALLASILYAILPLHIIFSHEIITDGILPSFWLLTLLFAFLALKTRRIIFYSLSGISLALSILLKFTSLSLLIILPLIFSLYRFEEIKHKNFKILIDSRVLVFLLCFILVMLPYLLWTYANLDSFLTPFFYYKLLIDWEVQTNWHAILNELPLLFIPYLFIGLILSLYFFTKSKKRKNILSLLLIVFLPTLLILRLNHIETRYFIPFMPFLIILSAQGFSILLKKSNKIIACISIILFSLATLILFLGTITFVPMPVSGQLPISMIQKDITSYQESLLMQASLWLKENTPKHSMIYSNYQWPVIAYYSQRKMIVLPVVKKEFQHEIDQYMPQDGYIILSSNSEKEPRLEFLLADARFDLVKQFKNDEETISTFMFQKRK